MMGDYHVPFCENLRLRCLGLLDKPGDLSIGINNTDLKPAVEQQQAFLLSILTLC
jgi:hypothetical protein